jgi:hypothetical protein
MIGRTVTVNGQEHTLVAIDFRQESGFNQAGHVLLLARRADGKLTEFSVERDIALGTEAFVSTADPYDAAIADTRSKLAYVRQRMRPGYVAMTPDAVSRSLDRSADDSRRICELESALMMAVDGNAKATKLIEHLSKTLNAVSKTLNAASMEHLNEAAECLLAKVAKLEHRTRMAEDDRGQAEEDAESSSTIITRATSQRDQARAEAATAVIERDKARAEQQAEKAAADRIRADLATEIAAHLETKHALTSINRWDASTIAEYRRKFEGVLTAITAVLPATTKHPIDVVQAIRDMAVEQSTSRSKLREIREIAVRGMSLKEDNGTRATAELVQNLAADHLETKQALRDAYGKTAEEIETIRVVLGAGAEEPACEAAKRVVTQNVLTTAKLRDEYAKTAELSIARADLSVIKDLATSVLGTPAPSDDTKVLVEMLRDRISAISGARRGLEDDLAAIRASVVEALRYNGTESTADLVSMLVDQFGAIADEYKEFMAFIGTPDSSRDATWTPFKMFTAADVERLKARCVRPGQTQPLTVHTINLDEPGNVSLEAELNFRRSQVSEAFEARSRITQALGMRVGCQAWSLLVRKADAIRSCRDELVDTIAEMRAEAKRVSESSGGSTQIATTWRPQDTGTIGE